MVICGVVSVMMFIYVSLLVIMSRNIIMFFREIFFYCFIFFDFVYVMYKIIVFIVLLFIGI